MASKEGEKNGKKQQKPILEHGDRASLALGG